MDLQGILSSVYCGSTMKNFIARAIWLISFPDVAKLCFSCSVVMLAVSPTAPGDNDSRVITNSGHLFFTWVYNLLLATSFLPLLITAGPSSWRSNGLELIQACGLLR